MVKTLTPFFFLVSTGVSPWIQRASDMKAEVVVNHDLERKLQQCNDEIVKLIKETKLKVKRCALDIAKA